jgi:hypothetical protein
MADDASTTDTAAAQTSGDSTDQTAATAAAPEDFRSKYEGQQKVNRDLERKLGEVRNQLGEVDTLKAELAKLQGKEAEFQAAQEAKRLQDQYLTQANERILKSEIRAAAAGKLSDPADALSFIDLSSLQVGDDGSVDSAAIEAAITNLIDNKPYLAAQGKRFQGDPDSGARKESAGVPQLTQVDMDRMSPEQKVAAHEAGQFDRLLGRS